MLFARLADVVIRRYKLIIIVWLVVLFYVFPLTFKLNSVVVYNQNDVGMNKLEAMRAGNVLAKEFPGRIPTSSITIVLQGPNMTSPEARTFASSLYRNITQDSQLQGVTSVDYLYSVLESYVQGVVTQTAPGLYALDVQTNQSAALVFGTSIGAAQQYAMFVVQGNNETQSKDMALAAIGQELLSSGQNSSMVNLTLGYAQTFLAGWNPSPVFNLTGIDNHIAAAADAFFPSAGQTSGFLIAVAHSFTVASFGSPLAQQAFAIATVSHEIDSTLNFTQEIWNLGPSPAPSAIAALAESTVFGYDLDKLPLAVPQPLVDQFVNVEPTDGATNNTMLIALSLSVDSSSRQASDDVRIIRELAGAQVAATPGFAAYTTGNPAINVDTQDAVANDVGRIDPVTVILVLVLVGLFFRSVVSPWIPLLTIGMAYLVTTAAVYLLGYYILKIDSSVLTFILVVMLGAGTDYCIFIMSRFREERRNGRSKEEAVRTSVTWAGESIATSGVTVMIGFGALMIGQYSLVRSMGMALVVAIGMALIFSLTMLPSLLMLVGDRIFWPNTMKNEKEREEKKERRGGGYFAKSARFSLNHRVAIVVVALIAVVPAVTLVFSLHTSYDFVSSLPAAESKLGIDAMASGFGKGNIMPTYVAVTFDHQVITNGTLDQSAANDIESYCRHVATMSNIRSISGPTRPFGTPVNASYLASLTSEQRATYELSTRSTFGVDNRTVMLTVILQDEPFTTTSIHSIDSLRTYDREAQTQVFGSQAQLLVGGSTASTADVSRTVANDFTTMRFMVIIGIYVVLMFVLGSLVMPLRLVGTVLFNVSVTVAMTMLVFQFVMGVQVLWLMPLILFVVAMGLGMDYDIFLTTRIREEVMKGKTDEKAITTAVERTGGIITACGLVMGGAFSTMMLSSTSLLKEFGFGLAFAILLDAMILRIYLVPAIMLLLQKWNWYAPGRLQRVRRGERSRKH